MPQSQTGSECNPYAHLQAILNAATEFAIITTDLQGHITLANAGAERLLGYPAADLIGKPISTIAQAETEVDERESTYLRKDGSPLSVILTITRNPVFELKRCV